jgi:hypothetical protein
MAGSDQEGCAVLHGDALHILDSQLPVSVRLSNGPEEILEAGWREHFEDATSARDHAPMCMGHLSGAEDEVTWRRLELRATDSEDMFTFEDVEKFIVAVVDVQRRVERVDLFNDRESASG